MTTPEPGSAYSRTGVRLFARYAQLYFKRHFTALRSVRGSLPAQLPEGAILYCNHPSWWDPLIMLLLAGTAFRDSRLYAPIDASALRRYPVLRRLGLYPVHCHGVAGVRRFLTESEGLLRAGHCLAVTAQGQFADPRLRPPNLRRGVARLLSGAPGRVAIPVALEYTFWNSRLPEALVSFGHPVSIPVNTSLDTATVRLEQALTHELDVLETASLGRDAARFDTLIGRERTDVDGVYGILRRLRGQQRQPSAPGIGAQGR